MKKNALITFLVLLGLLILAAFYRGLQESTNGWGIWLVLAFLYFVGLFSGKPQIVWPLGIIGALAVLACIAYIVNIEYTEYQVANPSPTPAPVDCAGVQPVQFEAGSSFKTAKDSIPFAVKIDAQGVYSGQPLFQNKEYWPLATVSLYEYPAACQAYVDTVVIPWLMSQGGVMLSTSPTQTPTAIPTQMLEPTLTPTVP